MGGFEFGGELADAVLKFAAFGVAVVGFVFAVQAVAEDAVYGGGGSVLSLGRG